jgi:hypothetical protein
VTPATAATGAFTTPAQSPEDTPSGTDEVTGIVGTVNVATRTIEINRLRGAAVARVAVAPATDIRRAGGGAIKLSDIRPSDRIIATGAVDERAGSLTADRITVQDVVRGSQPGG